MMEVLSKEELYRCDICGGEFHSRKEYDSHCCNVSKAYCLHISDCNSNSGYVSKFTIIDGCFSSNPPAGRKDVSKGMMFFDGMAIKGTDPKNFIGKVFWKKEYSYDKPMLDTEKVRIDSKPEDVYVFFTDASQAPVAFRKAFDAMKPYLLETADNLLKQYNDKFKNYSDLMLNDASRLFEKINEDSDKIKELIDRRHELNLSISDGEARVSTWKSEGKNSEKIFKRFRLDSSKSVSIAEIMSRASVKEKEKKGKKPKYSKDDWFIMRINLNWADEIDFECHEVINGEQRLELERLASKPNTVCRISFGTNEHDEYDDVLSCLSFSKISSKDYDVLNRLGLLHTGRIGYDTIMESFEQGDEE